MIHLLLIALVSSATPTKTSIDTKEYLRMKRDAEVVRALRECKADCEREFVEKLIDADDKRECEINCEELEN